MTERRLDDQTADRLLGGSVAPEDAPPGFATVAALVRAARGPATEEELAAVPFTPPARPATVRGLDTPAPQPVVVPLALARRRRRAMAVRVALVVGVVALGTTAAAASQGKLPDPVQRTVSKAAEHVGWDVPLPGEPRPPSTTDEVPGPSVGAASPTNVGGGQVVAAERSLCDRFGDGAGQRIDRPPFDALIPAAFPAGRPTDLPTPAVVERIAAYCQGLVSPVSTGGGPGGPNATSPGNPEPGQPPTSTPGNGPPTSTPGNPAPGTAPPSPPGGPVSSGPPTTPTKPDNQGSAPPSSTPGNQKPDSSPARGTAQP